MYLLIQKQEEETHLQTFSNLKEAKAEFKTLTTGDDAKWNIGVALYDLTKSSNFGFGGNGFYGDAIEEWENEDF